MAGAIHFFISTHNKQNNEHRSLSDYKKTFFRFFKPVFVYNYKLDYASPGIVILYTFNLL
jgi:hypothetical protein